jgi:hypothetical protein
LQQNQPGRISGGKTLEGKEPQNIDKIEKEWHIW